MYGIVIHGVPSDVLSTTALSDAITAREIELQNNILRGTITKISTLQRRGPEEKPRSHYSIVIHLNNRDEANKKTRSGVCLNYGLYTAVERFTPQFQLK